MAADGRLAAVVPRHPPLRCAGRPRQGSFHRGASRAARRFRRHAVPRPRALLSRDFLGVLVVEGDAEALERQHDDLVDLAAFFTLALDNARAFEGQLARRREAETFAAISAALAESTDLHRVLSRVARDAAELTGFERGTVLLLDDSGNVLPSMSQFANDDEAPEQWEAFQRIPSEDLRKALALVGGEEPRILPTAEDLSVVVGRPLVELFHLRSAVILPLVAWEERFGVLILDRSREGAPTSEQMQLAATVAAQAAVAIGVSRTLERERTLVARLRELDDLKNTFIASISHELRTPLTSIIGFAGLLESTVTEDDEREFAGYIVRESRQLENLIGNLLDASRIEAGRLSLDIQPVDLAVIIGEAVDLVGYVFPDRLGDLTVQAPPLVVDGDPARLRQVLTNLVENAAKYTSPGVGIEVTLTSTDTGAAIAVADHGPGIPATEHEAIFERFYRIAGSGRSGTGIGLFLVRQLVEAHGGAVRCESGPDGTGTRFVIELPMALTTSHFSPT